jgi:molybdopterin synthase sulfur carrier subunit
MADATTQAATLSLLYFAWLRERVGTAEESLPIPAGVATVGDLVEWLRGRGPGHAAAFAQANRVRCAVNQEFAGPDTPLRPGDEVAFFPPVTGG